MALLSNITLGLMWATIAVMIMDIQAAPENLWQSNSEEDYLLPDKPQINDIRNYDPATINQRWHEYLMQMDGPLDESSFLPTPVPRVQRPAPSIQEDKRYAAPYMCHFKICNLGRKRNLLGNSWNQ